MSDDSGRRLYDLAVRYRDGDVTAGWDFAMSPQIQACVRYWAGRYAKLSYTTEEDIEDLKSDLTASVLEVLGDRRKLKLPNPENYDRPEAAIVAWFKLAMQGMARKSMRRIVSPRVGADKRRSDSPPPFDKPFSQLLHASRVPDHVTIDEVFDLTYEPNPTDSLDKSRRLRLLAAARRHFTNDEDARIGYEGMVLHNELGNWQEVALALGLPKGKDRSTKALAMRMRNVIKSAAIIFGENVQYDILSIHTRPEKASVCVMQSNGTYEIRSYHTHTPRLLAALRRRVRDVIDKRDVTFAVMNMDDRSSATRTAVSEALYKREPIVELLNTSWIEHQVAPHLPRFTSASRRMALVMAHVKKAQCELRLEGAA